MNMFKGANHVGRPMPNANGERDWRAWAEDFAAYMMATYGEKSFPAMRDYLNQEAAEDEAREEAIRNERYAARMKQGC